MYRSKSARSGYGSDGSREAETDSNEVELNRLQQQYRVKQGEKKQAKEQKELIIRKNEDKITKLVREQNELIKNYNLAVSRQNKNRDSMYTAEIQAGIDRSDELVKAIEEEKKIQAQLDNDLRGGDKRNQNIRVKSATMKQKDGATPNAAAGDRQRNDLEGRLYRARSKFNTNLTQNSQLRKQIETLVISHRNYENENKKLHKKIKSYKREINLVMEASSMAHEQRADAKNKNILLRERAEKDLAQYASDIKDLQRNAENDFILKEFMDLKNQEREEKAHGTSHAKKARHREMEQLVEKCSSSWLKIQEISGTDDLEEMVYKFTETERENFALFNFINELNNIIEAETEEIDHVKTKFSSQTNLMQDGDDNRAGRFALLKSEVEREKEINEEKQIALGEFDSQFQELQTGLKKLLEQLDINFTIDTNADLMNSLGEIEDRLIEMVAAKAILMEELHPDVDNHQAIRHILIPEPPALPLEDPPLLQAPSTGEHGIHDIDIDESPSKHQDNLPMTINEMRDKIKSKSTVSSESKAQMTRKKSMMMRPVSHNVTNEEKELDLE